MSGRTTSVAISYDYDGRGSKAVFIGAANGGVWRSTDFTDTAHPVWIPRTDHLPGTPEDRVGALVVISLIVDTNKQSTLYACTVAGLLKSSDGGDSWTITPKTRSLGLQKVYPDPNDESGATVYGIGNGSGGLVLLKSADGGATWNPQTNTGLPGQRTVWDLDYLRDENGQVRFLLALNDTTGASPPQNGLWSSVDLGATWQFMRMSLIDYELGATVPPKMISRITLATDRNVGSARGAFALVKDDRNTHILNVFALSSDSIGEVWAPATGDASHGGLPHGLYLQIENQPITISPGGVVYIGTATGGVFQTIDRGTHWKRVDVGNGPQPHVDGWALGCDGERVYYTGDGGVFRFTPNPSSTGKGTWESLNSGGLQTHLLNGLSQHPTNPAVFLCGSEDNSAALRVSGVWKYATKGDAGLARFDPDPSLAGQFAYVAGPPDPNPYFFDRSDDHGATWHSKGFFSAPDDDVPFYPLFTINPVDTKRLLFGLAHVWETRDRGDNWTAISPALIGPKITATAIAYSSDGKNIYAAFGKSLYVSFNDGGAGGIENWNEIGGGKFPGNVQAIATDPIFAQHVFIATDNGRILRSQQAGGPFVDITGDFPNIAIWSMALYRLGGDTQLWIFLGTDVGVWATTVTGSETPCWTRFGAGLPDAQFSDLQVNYHTGMLIAGSWGRGGFFISLSTSDLPTAKIVERKDNCGVGAVEFAVATLDANAAGFNGALQYSWSVDAGGSIVGSSTSASLKVILQPGPHVLKLTVTDADGASACASLSVTPLTIGQALLLEFICRLKSYLHINWFFNPLWDPLRDRVLQPITRAELVRMIQISETTTSLLKQVLAALPREREEGKE
jgi:photosystem II stability/assembly factor-like uncharacterized protein